MNVNNIQAITELNELLYNYMPVRTMSSCEELDKFLEPGMQAHLQENISYQHKEKIAAQSEKAIETWLLIEQDFLENTHLDRITFLDAVSRLQSDEVLPDSLKRFLPNCNGVIFNIEWVNAFAWELPILFPKEIERFHNIGKMMAGIFYLERYNKAGRTISDALKAERISALMKIIRFTENSDNKITQQQLKQQEVSPRKVDTKLFSLFYLNDTLNRILPVLTKSSYDALDKFFEPEMQPRIQAIISQDQKEKIAVQAEKAIETWQVLEQNFLENIHLDRIAFLDAVFNLHSDEILPDNLKLILPNSYGVKIEWINTFFWHLPILFPKEIERFRNIGKMMAGVFYLERYNKAGRTISDALKAERISTLMKIIRFTNNNSNNKTTSVTNLLNKVGNLLVTQQQMKQQEFDRVITEAKPHVVRIEKDQKEQALKFNVFSALGVTRKEVIQSRFLAYLLDPNEHHCQETLFLNPFLMKIGLPAISPEQIKRVQVTTEHSAGESLGRMDIVLACQPDWLVVIENKVDAGEADQQLTRYNKWLQKQPRYNLRKLIFLTPAGHESETGHAIDYLRLSYLDLAVAFELLLSPNMAVSVRTVLTQYITICKHIGGMDVTKDQPLLDLLVKPENIKIALEIEQQAQLIRNEVVKGFGEQIQKILQSKLESSELSKTWKASSFGADQSALNVDIRTLKHQGKPNYTMRAEHVFSPRNWGWSGWFRPQWIDLKNQPPETLDTKDLTEKMINNGCNGAESNWVGSKDLRDGKKGFVPTDIDDIVACLEDNRSEDHPLANTIAKELWEMFTTYREDIEALASFKLATSL